MSGFVTFAGLLVWGIIAACACRILLPISWRILTDRGFADEEINRDAFHRVKPNMVWRIVYAALTAAAPLCIAAFWVLGLTKALS
ncbi:hypothetical protein [Paracoccus yeei]|uniref:hypothetical protein n=1 Tax=Paracoccus yeei TaxID=147645 RepID=UPI00174B56EB|nr:hypothetical protein [Paracoccus yeei]